MADDEDIRADLASRVLEGDDVRIFLNPDPAIKERRTQDVYVEALDLPHIIVVSGHFWAAQRKMVTLANLGDTGFRTCYYAYYSGIDIFANTVHPDFETKALSETGISQIMSTGRYRDLRWKTTPGYRRVFDSAQPEDTAAYVKAIEDGARFKALLQIDEDHFQVHPVIYPFFYPQENRVDIQTEIQFFPDYMRQPRAALLGLFEKMGRDYAQPDDPETKASNLPLKTTFFCSFYRVDGTAKAQRIYDLHNENRITLKRLVLFAAP